MKSSVSRRSILESDLVLTSMGIETRIERRMFEWRLLTLEALATHARVQLDLYYKENKQRQRPFTLYPTLGVGYYGAVVYLAVIWLVFLIDQANFIGRTGVLSAAAVDQGAWWLTVTALTLHANLSHIVANSVTGALFGYATGRYLGDGFAWFLILISGALGNLLNAWMRPDTFYAIGASTACFAAAGVLCGFTWRKSFVKGASARFNYLPIAGAIALFVFMGMEGENTDVVGHLMGLAVGLGVGALIGGYDVRRLGSSGQKLSAIAAIGLLIVSWIFAL
ncbi:MAG: rhomboid family intramembrane serine protease [Gammaproteobacteria bacterium]|nr:rhomboid family intramembrane serine protease [Gammaproteobacteria bacterium]